MICAIALLPLKLLILCVIIPLKFVKSCLHILRGSKTHEGVCAPFKRVLITGARSPYTLELARLFFRAGHQVHVADTLFQRTTLLSFSRFHHHYHLLKQTPNEQPYEKFQQELAVICVKHRIDLLIPTCEEVFWVSRHKKSLEEIVQREHKSFTVFTETLEKLRVLHNKFEFNKHVSQVCGLKTPFSHMIQSNHELCKMFEQMGNRKESSGNCSTLSNLKQTGFVLKPAFSRFASKTLLIPADMLSSNNVSLALEKISQLDTICEQNPLVIQEFIEGDLLCSYSIVCNGAIQAHTVYKGGEFTSSGTVVGGSIVFSKVDPVIASRVLHWVQQILAKPLLTSDRDSHFMNGQICFDFILQRYTNELMPLECNPRATSGVHLFYELPHALTASFFGNRPEPLVVTHEHPDTQLALAMIVHLMAFSCTLESLKQWVKAFWRCNDVIFEWQDPLPFLLGQFVVLVEPFWKMLYYRTSYVGTFTLDIEWNGE